MTLKDAWTSFPQLESQRLLLRQLDPETDAADYYDGISKVNLDIWSSREKASLEKVKQHLEFNAAAYRRKYQLRADGWADMFIYSRLADD